MQHDCNMELTCERGYAMSALPPIADICSATAHVYFWANSGHRRIGKFAHRRSAQKWTRREPSQLCSENDAGKFCI
jgi:hypothetical protein